jgi:glutaryl-CoA dehydrogenase
MVPSVDTSGGGMAKYESLNFMETDSLFTAEELIVRNTVREFVTEEVIPELQRAHRDETFPKHLIPRFGELGLLGSTIQGYGCPGLGDIAYGFGHARVGAR